MSTPHYWRNGLPGETEEEYSSRLAKELEDLILREGPETIAAFIAEPVMGAGGVIPPPKGYFQKIQPILQKYDILFILDEVITAFGRLGERFGSDFFDIQPDLYTVAKAMSSSYYCSARPSSRRGSRTPSRTRRTSSESSATGIPTEATRWPAPSDSSA